MIKLKTAEEIMKNYLDLKIQANKYLKNNSTLAGGIEGIVIRKFIRRENPRHLPYNISRCKKQ